MQPKSMNWSVNISGEISLSQPNLLVNPILNEISEFSLDHLNFLPTLLVNPILNEIYHL